MKTFHDFKETELSKIERQDAIIKKINAKLGCIAIPNEEHTKELILLFMENELHKSNVCQDRMRNKMTFFFDNIAIMFSLADDVWTIEAHRMISFQIDANQAMEVAEKIVNAFKD